MKALTVLLIILSSIASFGQKENEREVLINKTQLDDTYRAGETIKVNASIQGDLIIAGGNLIINDSVNGDLTAAGGQVSLNGYVADDVRLAVGRVTINSEIGDDLVIFGGEVILTENAKIHGNLKCFAGSIEINGTIIGKLDIRGDDVIINATVEDTSKIIGEEITLGANAKFAKDVQYWNDNGEIDFKNALVNAKAEFNEDLGDEQSQLSLTKFGTNSFKLWMFYILSSFLVILVMHALFKNAFSGAVESLENNLLKSFGFGLIYLVGFPLMILLAFLMIIGIPLGLFATAVFVFSLFFGHLIAALLVVYYLKTKNNKNWGFWSITFLALFIAVILRLLTMIPYVGILLSVIILSITYGGLTLKVIESKKQLIKDQEKQ